MRCRMSVTGSRKNSLFLLMALALMSLQTSCVLKKAVILPDPKVIHRVAEDGELIIYVRADGDSYVKQKVRIVEGSWVGSPSILDK
jgi:hypothetical protein